MRHILIAALSFLLLADAPSTAAQTWPFNPAPDTFSSEALLDLSHLNEGTAGQSGFIRRSTDGSEFVLGDGTPVRLWAVNTGVQESDDLAALRTHAKFLAKRGVNAVRWHGQIGPKSKEARLTDIDLRAREQLWKLVAAMRDEGIYVIVSPYYAMPFKKQDGWEVPRDSESFHGLLFFDPVMQEAYRSWLRQLLEPVNPHTGVALKDEPAIAVISIQNEDSLLFWTFNGIKGRDRELLRQAYGAWLLDTYGSADAVRQRWQNVSAPGGDGPDDWQTGHIALSNIWHLTQPVQEGSGYEHRYADQTRFLVQTMRRFNADVVRYLREDIGAKQLVNAGNWRPASPEKLFDAERYSYTSADVAAVNRYYNGGHHEGKHAGWAIVSGDRFTAQSVLRHPREFPLLIKQIAGHPMLVTESLWVPPLTYQSEGPLLVGCYGAFSGLDGFVWFSQREPQWRQPGSANGYLPSRGKWVANTPPLMGTFPAAALIYRLGLVEPAEQVFVEDRPLEDLWYRRPPLLGEEAGFDPNRDEQPTMVKQPRLVDPATLLETPVVVRFGDDSGSSAPLAPARGSRYVSSTGQLTWDSEGGLFTVNAPKAQGATGFLGRAGQIGLADVSMLCKNDYATIVVVPLDGQPVRASRRLLVQTTTVAWPTGWQQRPVTWQDDKKHELQGFEVVDFGRAPWRIEQLRAAISIVNPHVTRAVALDPSGMAQEQLTVRRAGERVLLDLPLGSMYTVLHE